MGKIEKHAEFMDQLHSMISKTGTAGKATGKPGADTHYESVSKENDTINKNKEGHPEKLEQVKKQERASDGSDPTKTHKSAEVAPEAPVEAVAEPVKEANVTLPDTKPAAPAKIEAPPTMTQHEAKKASDETPNEKLAQLGQQLLDTITELQKTGTAGVATGKPGADTHYVSVSKENEHVNKNNEGHPEKLEQVKKQEKASDPSDPTKAHKAAEDLELDKEASFELGRQFARAFLTSKTASVDSNIYKEAGRRDFETLISTAAAELEHEVKPKNAAVVVKEAQVEENEELQIKQAEEAGAQAFYTILKQAQDEEQTNQIKLAFEQKVKTILAEKEAAEKKAKELADKVASFELAAQKAAEDEKLNTKFAQWGSHVVEEILTRLKQTPAN